MRFTENEYDYIENDYTCNTIRAKWASLWLHSFCVSDKLIISEKAISRRIVANRWRFYQRVDPVLLSKLIENLHERRIVVANFVKWLKFAFILPKTL